MSLTFSTLARRKAATSASRIIAKRCVTTTTSVPKARTPFLGGKRLTQVGALGLGLGAAQHYFGNAENLFEHKFKTTKSPEDLADFYGTEDFMEVFCVLPFMVNFMMRGAEFGDDGTIHAWGLLGPGELQVKIDFDEREIDTNGDGEPDTLAWFNKKEHFHDVAPSFLGGFTLWEMTQNFGYHRLDDGTCEVYHHGEKFDGFFPIRLLFQLHARYVIWATEKYVNSDAFGAEDRDTELEESRQNIPVHVFKEFIDGLTTQVEKVQEKTKEPKQQDEIKVTLQRLKTISNMDHSASLPRLRTLRSHKTKVTRMHLIVDDPETKDTIRAAMQEIGSSKNQKPEAVTEINKLARRTTMAAGRRLKGNEGGDSGLK